MNIFDSIFFFGSVQSHLESILQKYLSEQESQISFMVNEMNEFEKRKKYREKISIGFSYDKYSVRVT